MDLRSLRYFAEVAKTGNFSLAATHLHRTQPAVSRCISDLEAELGLRLFERIGRRASLTSTGRSLLEQVQSLLTEVDRVTEYARLLSVGKRVILRVGAVPNMIERALPKVLSAYKARFPDIEVVLRPDGGTDLLKLLEDGIVDIALARHVKTASLDSRPAFPFYLLAVMHEDHSLARRKMINIADLASSRVLLAPRIMASRTLFDTACYESRVRPQIALESVEFNALVALAAADQGIAVVPSTAITSMRKIRALPIFHKGKPLGAWAALVWDRRRQMSSHAKDFVSQALSLLRKDFPGKDLRLPAPQLRIADRGTPI
jgi:LysR family transcriptional regulator, cyn operon transcriptional activator